MKELERLFKALSDGTRLRIICLLEPGSLCVCQIVEVLGLSQSTVSKHLSILKNAGLVSDEKRGRWSYYGLSNKSGKTKPVLSLVFSSACKGSEASRDRRKLQKNSIGAQLRCKP